jgi:hypothetical protein
LEKEIMIVGKAGRHSQIGAFIPPRLRGGRAQRGEDSEPDQAGESKSPDKPIRSEKTAKHLERLPVLEFR